MPVQLIATAVAAVCGAAAGGLLQRNLETLGYRHDKEQDRPAPRWHPVLPFATAAIAGVLAFRATATGDWLRIVLTVPVLTLGVWLASVDADVQRLPYRHTLTLTATQTVLIGALTFATNNPGQGLTAAVGGLACYLGFFALHCVSKGGLGRGDVTLVLPLAATVTAAGGPGLLWWWLLGSLTAAAATALARRAPRLPLAPWLVGIALLLLALFNSSPYSCV